MQTPSPRRPWKWLVWLVVAPAALFAAYTWIVLSWSYSQGERAGYVQKLSHRGWLCKTWEGELALVTMPGTVAEKFLFTVRDEAVAARINASVGRRVALVYEQHLGVPLSCFGDTGYYVTDVREVAEGALMGPPPGTPAPATAVPAPGR